MRQSRSSLNSEVKESKKNYEEKSIISKAGVIIAKQQEVIQSLSN